MSIKIKKKKKNTIGQLAFKFSSEYSLVYYNMASGKASTFLPILCGTGAASFPKTSQ